MPKSLFISYSHVDATHLKTLRTHLKPLERAGLIEPWSDTRLLVGDDIDEGVKAKLSSSELILFLVSPDFLASDYCQDIELNNAIARHERGECRIVPVILRKCRWQLTPLSRLRATPTDAQAILSSAWPDKDEAWDIVTQDVSDAAKFDPTALAISASQQDYAVAPSTPSTTPKPAAVSAQKALWEPLTVPRRNNYSDEQKDDFRDQSYQTIARVIEHSIAALSDGLSGRFREIDKATFAASIYRDGKRAAGCTISNGRGFTRNSISYSPGDDGSSSGFTEILTIETDADGMFLKSMMGNLKSTGEYRLSADDAARLFWRQLTHRL